MLGPTVLVQRFSIWYNNCVIKCACWVFLPQINRR